MNSSRQTFLAVFFGVTFALSFISKASVITPASLSPGFYDNANGSPVVDLIDQAKSTVDIEVYEMDDPKVIAAIRSALNRGITVHVVKEPDPVGATCKVFSSAKIQQASPSSGGNPGSAPCADQQKLVDEVNQAGGKYVPFTKPDLCGADGTKSCLQHGKIVVVDSKMALITSGNFNTTNLCDLAYSPQTCNRDYSYLSEDSDVVTTLQSVIEGDLVGKKYDVSSVMTSGADAKLTVGPNSLAPMIAFIKSATRKIQIENQYLKEPTINAALVSAAKKGIEVQITVASACSFGKPKATEAKRLTTIFTEFDKAGIATRMFNKNILVNGKAGYLHAKAIVVDGNRAWMGSVNGSTQAATLNREFGVFFSDSANVNKLASVMSSDFADPNEESWQDSLICAEKN